MQAAYDLNCPLVGNVTGRQEGILPKRLSLIGVNRENVIVEAVKKAESDNGIILRVFEAYNRRSEVCIKFFKNIEYIAECDLMENEISEGNEIDFRQDVFSFIIKPFELKTFKLDFD